MSTLSVPLPPELSKSLEDLVKKGHAANKADAARKAIKKYIEDKAVEDVLLAAKEPSIEGDLDDLLEKI